MLCLAATLLWLTPAADDARRSASPSPQAQKKAASSSKDKVIAEVNAASGELADAQQGWLIESPQVFGLYQSIDAGRLTALKEILTKWETTRSDVARGEMEASERVMMMVLSWDTLEDQQDFLLKKGSVGGSGPGGDRPPGSRMVSGASNMSRSTSASSPFRFLSAPAVLILAKRG